MDEPINRKDYQTIVQCLSIMRLQSWLVQRLVAEDAIDDAELVERLGDIDRQTGKINDILNTVHGLAPIPPEESGEQTDLSQSNC